MLLSPALLPILDRSRIVCRAPLVSRDPGPRRASVMGDSVEFRDFRPYQPGDDPRRLDWNAYARLDRLFLRQYTAEVNAIVTLLIDCSPSMGFGTPTRWLMVQQLCAALAYSALAHDDRLAIGLLTDRLHRYLPPVVGRARVPHAWQEIERLSAQPPQTGAGDLGAALRAMTYMLRGKGGQRGGICLLISDLLTPADWPSGVRALQSIGQQVGIIQVLLPDDRDPPMRGDCILVDTEMGGRATVSLSPWAIDQYKVRFRAHQATLSDTCRHLSIPWVSIITDQPLIDVLRTSLPHAGFLA